MKKIFLSLLVVFMVLSLSVVLVKAEGETSVALTDGVQIRTDGNNGLRWEAKVENAQEGQVYGFLFAQGELTAEQLNKDTANVVAKEVEGLKEDGTYHATMINFPKSAAVQDITVRAYVKTGEVYTYSENVVVRNLAEVAVLSKNSNEGEFIDSVVEHIESNYMKVYSNKHAGYYIDSAVYESNYEKLKVEFIKDWNEKFSSELDPETAFVVSSYNSPFKTAAMATNIADSNLYNFFNDEVYKVKWGWLLTYFEEETNVLTASSYSKNQFLAIKDGNSDLADGDWYKGQHFISYFLSFFNGTYKTTGYGGYRFENNLLALANVATYNNKVFADLSDCKLIKNGETIKLPTALAPANGYVWAGWNDGTTKYVAESDYQVTNNSLFLIPSYSPINYTIKYYDGDTELLDLAATSYNIESDTISLPNYIKDGYTFDGWYLDPEFTEPISAIEKGSYGNIVLYAKTTKITGYTINYVLNGGNISYANKEAVIDDLFKDINAYKGTSYSPSSLGVLSGIYSIHNLYTALQDSTLNAKWLWLLEFLAATETNSNNKSALNKLTGQSSSSWNTSSDSYAFEYVLAAFANDMQYTKNSGFITADYSLNENNNFWGYLQKTDTIQVLNCTGTVTLNVNVYKLGYKFDGWYTSAEFTEGTKVETVNAATTVYAKWLDQNDLTTIVELSDSDLAVLESQAINIVVNKSFVGGKYSVNDKLYKYGETAFSDIASAMTVVKENDVIYVFAGTYNDSLTISTANVSILGPNANISGSSSSRATEAIFTGTIEAAASATNLVLNGLHFGGDDSKYLSVYYSTDTNHLSKISLLTGIKGFTFKNNYVTAGRVFIKGINNQDTVISNNFFNWTAETAKSYSYWRPIRLDGTSTNFKFENNKVVQSVVGNGSSGFYDLIYFQTNAGTLDINNNDIACNTYNWTFNIQSAANVTTFNANYNKLSGATVNGAGLVNVAKIGNTTICNLIGNKYAISISGTTYSYQFSSAASYTGKVTIELNSFAQATYKPRFSSTLADSCIVHQNNYIAAATITSAGSSYKALASTYLDNNFDTQAELDAYLATLE